MDKGEKGGGCPGPTRGKWPYSVFISSFVGNKGYGWINKPGLALEIYSHTDRWTSGWISPARHVQYFFS